MKKRKMQITLPQLGPPMGAPDTASPGPRGPPYPPLRYPRPCCELWLCFGDTLLSFISLLPKSWLYLLVFPRSEQGRGLCKKRRTLGAWNPRSGGNSIYQQEEKACSVNKDSKHFSCSSPPSSFLHLLSSPKGFSLLITHRSSLMRRMRREEARSSLLSTEEAYQLLSRSPQPSSVPNPIRVSPS